MKFSGCLLFLICFSFGKLKAQSIPDSLQLSERTFSYSFYQGPMRVGHNRLKVVMKDCPLALQRYDSGKRTESFGLLLLALGLVTSAASLGDYYLNDRSEFPAGYVAAGAICIGVGIPIYFSGSRSAKSSVLIFNQKCLN